MSWDRECGRKVRYFTRRAAKQATKRFPGEHVSPYQCSFCEHWHIGHWRPGVRRV